MLRRPRDIGQRKMSTLRDYEAMAARRDWAQSQQFAFDDAPIEWRELYRDFAAEDINDVIEEKNQMTTVAEIRTILTVRLGNGHPLYRLTDG